MMEYNVFAPHPIGAVMLSALRQVMGIVYIVAASAFFCQKADAVVCCGSGEATGA